MRATMEQGIALFATAKRLIEDATLRERFVPRTRQGARTRFGQYAIPSCR